MTVEVGAAACSQFVFLVPFLTATATDVTSPLTIGVSNPVVKSLGY